MNVTGIDYRTGAVDVIRLDDDTDRAEWHRFELAGATAFERARTVAALVPAGAWWDDTYLCGIEETFSRTFNAATGLARVQGALLATIPLRVAVIPTPANEWQRVFLRLEPGEKLGDREARKAAVRRRCVELGFGDAPDLPQDAYDAYGIAWAVRELNRRAIEASEAA